jgi:hypothetical protein
MSAALLRQQRWPCAWTIQVNSADRAKHVGANAFAQNISYIPCERNDGFDIREPQISQRQRPDRSVFEKLPEFLGVLPNRREHAPHQLRERSDARNAKVQFLSIKRRSKRNVIFSYT